MMSSINNKENTLKIALLYPKEGILKDAHEYKASQDKIRLDQINMVEKIEIHKRTRQIIFTNLLHSTLSNDKL